MPQGPKRGVGGHDRRAVVVAVGLEARKASVAVEQDRRAVSIGRAPIGRPEG